MRLIPIADIVSAHGIKGGLKVYLYNTDDPLLLQLKSIYAGTEEENGLFRILRVKRIGIRFCILNLDGIRDRQRAESFRGKKLFITPDMLPELPENMIYISLLIGYCVFDENGNELGVVEDFINNGAQDIMIVRRLNCCEFMVPFVDEFIKRVDTNRSQIIIRLMDGLI